MPATIYFVRHAQGYHNLPKVPGGPNPSLLADPDLTELGKEQCAELSKNFPFHDKITHLVASPLRRTLYTCLLSFGPVLEQGRVQKVTALPELQEIAALPSDTGSDPAVLAKEFGGEKVDLGLVKDDWTDKGPGSPFAPELEKLDARARAARIWLRKLASEVEGDEAHIVVVTHGAILHFLTEDWDGTSIYNSKAFFRFPLLCCFFFFFFSLSLSQPVHSLSALFFSLLQIALAESFGDAEAGKAWAWKT